jgi:hypothetical protein
MVRRGRTNNTKEIDDGRRRECEFLARDVVHRDYGLRVLPTHKSRVTADPSA